MVLLTSTAPALAGWSRDFSLPGPDRIVYWMTTYQDQLVAGGLFDTADDVFVNNVGCWDGVRWHALGAGLDGPVHAFAVFEDHLVASGNFITSGGDTVKSIAAWDGSRWSSLGQGIDGKVLALAVCHGLLYAAGEFNSAGGVSARNIAAWDGEVWRPLGSGVSDDVNVLLASGDNLLVAGRFSQAGDLEVPRIAAWDGQSWQPLPHGDASLPGWPVYTSLVEVDGALYAGYAYGSNSCLSIWQEGMRSDYQIADECQHVALTPYGSTVAVAVTDYDIQSEAVKGDIYEWAGTHVGAHLGLCDDGLLYSLHAWHDSLFVAGQFTYMSRVPATGLAELNPEGWRPVTSPSLASRGLFGGITAMTITPDQEIITSQPRAIGSGSMCYMFDVLRLGSDGWELIRSVPDKASKVTGGVAVYTCETLGFYEGRLVIGGGCLFESGIDCYVFPVLHILDYNGAAGKALAGYTCQAVFEGDLILGSRGDWDPYYPEIDHDVVHRLVDGSHWQSIGAGVIGVAARALAIYNGDLVVAGQFHTAGGKPVRKIAVWNGEKWGTFGSGFDSAVLALAVFEGRLVAAGDFQEADGIPVQRIAIWDGNCWSPLGEGFDARVAALAVHDGILVAGGGFNSSGSESIAHLARWTGESWRSLGGGVSALGSSSVSTLCSAPGKGLYVGGSFRFSGNVRSWNIALWEGSVVGTYLAGLTARREGGAARIAWLLGEVEPGTGFHVWREEADDGGRIRLTVSPIAADLAGAWTDPAPPAGATVYWLQLVEADGATSWLGSAELPAAEVPAVALGQDAAVPNPFNPRTTIRYRLPAAQEVTLAVHDLRGRLVRVLAEGCLAAGEHSATWDGLDRRGAEVAAGIYLLRLQSPGGVLSRKLVLAR